MFEVGIGFLAAGLFLLVVFARGVKSEAEFAENLEEDARVREEMGEWWSRQPRQYLTAARVVFRHPVMARLPGVLLTLVGLTLIFVASS